MKHVLCKVLLHVLDEDIEDEYCDICSCGLGLGLYVYFGKYYYGEKYFRYKYAGKIEEMSEDKSEIWVKITAKLDLFGNWINVG